MTLPVKQSGAVEESGGAKQSGAVGESGGAKQSGAVGESGGAKQSGAVSRLCRAGGDFLEAGLGRRDR